MSDPKGSSDDSIGRPTEWREGRYQQPGKAVDQSVVPAKSAEVAPAEVESTPVTHEDYENLTPDRHK